MLKGFLEMFLFTYCICSLNTSDRRVKARGASELDEVTNVPSKNPKTKYIHKAEGSGFDS
jgi:hypothetical protein